MLWHMLNYITLLQKVDIDLRTAVNCVNNLQSLMESFRDVSNNDIYDKIYQKAADMVSLMANVVTANFCEVEPALHLFLLLILAPTDKD